MPDTNVVHLFPSLINYLNATFFQENQTVRIILIISGFLLCAVLAYLLGSINFGIVFSKGLLKDDIRQHGSGNAGATNMLRTFGKKFAVLTLIMDVLKGSVAVVIGALLLDIQGAAVAGFFAVFGHMFPIFFKFKGGKGVSTTFGVVLLLSPLSAAILLLIYLIIFLFTHYVSLASVMTVLIYPLVLNAMAGNTGMNVLMAVLTAVFVVFMHRSNIRRLFKGEESKTYLRKKKPKPEPQNDGTPDAGNSSGSEVDGNGQH